VELYLYLFLQNIKDIFTVKDKKYKSPVNYVEPSIFMLQLNLTVFIFLQFQFFNIVITFALF